MGASERETERQTDRDKDRETATEGQREIDLNFLNKMAYWLYLLIALDTL